MAEHELASQELERVEMHIRKDLIVRVERSTEQVFPEPRSILPSGP